MCLRNLFCGNDCTWVLFIIIVLLLIDGDDCGNSYGNGCGYNNASNNCGCC